jgi:hypothetical protein
MERRIPHEPAAFPHPALRATFSRWEKGNGAGLRPAHNELRRAVAHGAGTGGLFHRKGAKDAKKTIDNFRVFAPFAPLR